MVNEKKILFVLVFVIGSVLLLSLTTNFTGYSVSDGNRDAHVTLSDVLPGEVTKGEIRLEVSTDTVSHGNVLATGEAASWISFIDENYAFVPNVETQIPFYVTVPQDTAPGTYQAKVALLAADSGEGGSILQNSIISYIPITIIVNSTVKNAELSIDSFNIYSAEESDDTVSFDASLSNKGNIGSTKDLQLEIYDAKGQLVGTQSIHSDFVAYEQKKIVSSFPQSFAEGKYYARLIVGDQIKNTSFSIVPQGSLKRKGEFLSLEASVSSDNLVTLTGYFKNTGEAVVDATFSGTVFQNGESIKHFETDAQTITPGEYTSFQYTYSEALSGSYVLDAEVESDNFVLAEQKKDFYSSHAISLETNVLVILGLVMLLLLVSHYMLSRRKESG